MNWRKNIVLVVGGGIALLLLVAVVILLLRFQGQYRTASGELASAVARLQQLNNRDPFPSPENIAVMQENLKAVQASAVALNDTLQRGQLAPEAIEPAEFAPLLERVSKRLGARAAEGGVVLPDKFTYAFARYAAGELPAPAAIPRLVVQLKAIDAVCSLLFQARISELVSIDREVFEAGEASAETEETIDPRRQRRVAAAAAAPTATAVQLPPPETNDLYGVERLTITFAARETAAWDALNALARSPLFLAVVDVRVENTAAVAGNIGKKQPPGALGGEQAAAAGLAHYPSHDERVVAGREPVRVSLVLDLYRFSDRLREEATR